MKSKNVICFLTFLYPLLSFAAGNTPCKDSFEVETQFLYVIQLSGGELSEDQQVLAKEFKKLYEQEMGPQVICSEISNSNQLLLVGVDKILIGIMQFDDIGEIEKLTFEKYKKEKIQN